VHAEVSNRSEALEQLVAEVNINSAWKIIRVSISAKLLAQRKQAKLQWLEDLAETKLTFSQPTYLRSSYILSF
jgi:predicted aconitase